MPTLTVTRGLPGSGKTTWARERQRTAAFRTARINRDDLRRSMHGATMVGDWAERQVTLAQHAAIEALLRGGVDVICDDTNLRRSVVRNLEALAARCGAKFVIEDFTGVPVDVCVSRDHSRPADERVGEQVIRDMYRRYLDRSPRVESRDDRPETSPDDAPAPDRDDHDGVQT
jgi:tRNA uridine 5-carbamoylmethylation protein Kti12